jgi:hypothetical protein
VATSRNERLVQSQQLFRVASERFQAIAVGLVPAAQLIPFLCECADDACLARVDMNSAEYDDIHRDRDQYAVLQGHLMTDGEELVERRPLFDIVRKRAVAG